MKDEAHGPVRGITMEWCAFVGHCTSQNDGAYHAPPATTQRRPNTAAMHTHLLVCMSVLYNYSCWEIINVCVFMSVSVWLCMKNIRPTDQQHRTMTTTMFDHRRPSSNVPWCSICMFVSVIVSIQILYIPISQSHCNRALLELQVWKDNYFHCEIS